MLERLSLANIWTGNHTLRATAVRGKVDYWEEFELLGFGRFKWNTVLVMTPLKVTN